MEMSIPQVFTIGHSNRTINRFIEILISNKIHCLVDVRSYPGSKAMPQFGKELLKEKLDQYGIKYYHLPELGGRRKVKTNIHTAIEAPTFAGYADYMMTDEFKAGIANLKEIASTCRTAYMCAEGLYYKCHRKMISDRLVYDGWDVYHLGMTKEPIKHEVWDISRLDENGDIIYDQ